MAKIGKKKDQCKRYKESGRREENKRKKQERHEKRLAKFAARKEADKGYQWKPNPYKEGTNEYNYEARQRAEKNTGKKLPLQRFTSTMRKLQNAIDEKEREIKLAEIKKDGGNKRERKKQTQSAEPQAI